MKCYRFKHIPTGMYYRPSREVKLQIKNPDGSIKIWIYVKTNLSKKGKIYPQKPSWTWINGGYYNHLLVKQMIVDSNIDEREAWSLKDKSHPFIKNDWTLEEI
jgi:hypothetical protein